MKHNETMTHLIERVRALVGDHPAVTEKYMFGCRTVSDWQVGSPLTWEGVFDGKKLVAVKGGIVVLERPRRLHYTVFDPNANYVDEPRNYLHITYALTPVGNATRLEVTQGDFSTVEDGEKRYRDSNQGEGWLGLLKQIKAIAEQR